ncbi:MAG: hypothetical protein LQ343_007663 [Gyalolechia ehrenbergii]|nr:MAG: hypothetical protein LQ343_007663 [Gyalolechia ehrenbergii]
MPVTLNVASHQGRPWINPPPVVSTEQLFQNSCPEEYRDCKQVMQSSFNDLPNASICGSSNGFVRACHHAYSDHHHLTLRPEDIWLAILSQLNFHINAHAEELRSFFVAHEGRKELEVFDTGTIKTVDFGPLAVCMTKEMDKHIVDPAMRQWILPDFSTTTHTDTVTAAVLMMGAMQEYFSYKITLCCGIPSVTLLGEKHDWIKIQDRLDQLPQLGPEPAQFTKLLKPIMEYCTRSFDAPDDPEVRSFWTRIAHQNGGSGRHYLSGWITAFCFWDAGGKCLFNAPAGAVDTNDRSASYRTSPGCNIDGTLYHRVDTNDIPSGYVSVPVTVDDNGRLYKTRMMAGSVGIQLRRSGLPVDQSRAHMYGPSFAWGSNGDITLTGGGPGVGYPVDLDTLQPVSGWWMYEIANDAEGGNGHPGIVNSSYSHGDQRSRVGVKDRWRNKGTKAKEKLLALKERTLLPSNKA